ncbi:MAG: vWA domain-containing protein [Nanobdellota archaeon]
MWTIEFIRPDWLWLSLIIPLLIIAHFFFLKRTQTKALRFANFEAIKRVAGKRFVTKNITVLLIRIFVFSALILAVSGASFVYDGTRNDFDYVIAIDTSSSMTNNDISPSRFDYAKESSIDLLNQVDTTASFGLLSFSGVTFIQHPLSQDKLPLRLSIANLNISRTGGTDISGAIISATNLLLDSERGRALVLFTDGVDTVGAFIDDNVRQAVLYAKRHGVTIFPVALGLDSSRVSYLPDSFNLSTRLGSESLEYMANQTGGEVFKISSSESLEEDFSKFDTRASSSRILIDLQSYALIFAFGLLFIEWVLINLIFRRVI